MQRTPTGYPTATTRRHQVLMSAPSQVSSGARGQSGRFARDSRHGRARIELMALSANDGNAARAIRENLASQTALIQLSSPLSNLANCLFGLDPIGNRADNGVSAILGPMATVRESWHKPRSARIVAGKPGHNGVNQAGPGQWQRSAFGGMMLSTMGAKTTDGLDLVRPAQ